MTHAYSELYLRDAMRNLAEAFDYAANDCRMEIDDFMHLFIATGYADAFEKGNPKVIAGLSGTELAMEVLSKAKRPMSFPEPEIDYSRSIEYWCGWIVAYYQWKTGRPFKDIQHNVSMEAVRGLYHPLHEASEDKFVDTLNSIIRGKDAPSKLQRQRKECGYTQKELSEKSGVNLRTLQQYESRAKDINKASADAVYSLAIVLGCKVEDILECPTADIG